MGQQRLSMFARNKSIVDEGFERELQDIQNQIKEQAKAISQKLSELYEDRPEPEPMILQDGKIKIDDTRIREIMQPMKDHLKVLKEKYKRKKAQEPNVRKDATQQKDIFEI